MCCVCYPKRPSRLLCVVCVILNVLQDCHVLCYPKRPSRLLCVVCVILNVFRVMTFFLYRGGKEENFQRVCVCVCIKSSALVNRENMLEVDFYLHVHVSYHAHLINVVDECCCKTTGK